MNGILNLFKPKGISSAAAVGKVKKILNTRAVGHMGTLDPLAMGVLPIGIGKSTRLFDYYLKKNKKYIAEFSFGYQTDTLDSEGSIVFDNGIIPKQEQVEGVLSKLTGKIMQIPPDFCAKSVGGQKLYKLARQGKKVNPPPSCVNIYSISLIKSDAKADKKDNNSVFTFEIYCSSGTYIRSICRDMAQMLNTYATMTALTRTAAGDFELNDSVSLESLQQLKEDAIIPVSVALKDLPRVDIPLQFKKFLDCGVRFAYPTPETFTIYCDDILYGIGENDGKIHIKTFLKD